ncbi:uncharacterized protein EI97DRAFT_288854 [Westerdykella ornata]|uniref:Uncharacterized protein n=1 Tax=Westerdykella ornata TaxID=318751 RepID=A0A6A6JLH8_WESOR|nr:uncharacterized protein EI97DRAFT_288854 [Westerdykella ornata]KAF2277357.1 hypothetical protein EI97DRAFT_288854 [Westerdykella ornata]
MHGLEGIDQTLMDTVSNFDWQSPPPPLTVNTSFPASYGLGSEVDLAPFSAGSLPSIAITEAQSSPVPSFWSGTTRASSPERLPTSAPQMPLNLVRPPSSQPFSPPIAPPNPQSWEFIEASGHLKPQSSTVASRDLSRRSSISSASVESEEVTSSPFDGNESDDVDVGPLAPAPRLPRPGVFSAHSGSPAPSDRSRALGVIPLPSRFEAETLTSEFVQHLESFEGPKPYTLNPRLFARFCEMVYPDPKSRASSVDAPVSVPMARFHVFLAMAIGMKVRIKDSTEATNALLDRCYDLAMQQASNSVFWQEPGGIEAAQLLSIFASIRREMCSEPKPLRPSFTW